MGSELCDCAKRDKERKEQSVYTEGVRSSSLLPPNTDGKPPSSESGFHFWGRENGLNSIHVLFPREKISETNGNGDQHGVHPLPLLVIPHITEGHG